jgi:hypothetical protein
MRKAEGPFTRDEAAGFRDNRGMRPLLRPLRGALLASLLLLPSAFARDVADVLSALEASAAAIVDAQFVLDGVLIDEGGQTFAVEIEIMAIPGLPAAWAYILRPDAIADNMLVIDGRTVASYTFITHQTILFDLDDPDAFGGLLSVEPGGGLPIDLDLSVIFADWDAEIVDETATPRGPGVVLRFGNRDPQGQFAFVLATVVEGAWDPWRLAFYRQGGELFADLTFRDFVRNQGLSRADVTYLPEDAEVIDRRR